MHYSTGLRTYTLKRIEEIDSADILVGISCYNNEKTIYPCDSNGHPRTGQTLQ